LLPFCCCNRLCPPLFPQAPARDFVDVGVGDALPPLLLLLLLFLLSSAFALALALEPDPVVISFKKTGGGKIGSPTGLLPVPLGPPQPVTNF
jgi:hypothetical protein